MNVRTAGGSAVRRSYVPATGASYSRAMHIHQTRGKPLQKAPAYELPPSRTSPNGVEDCSVLWALCATFRPPGPAPRWPNTLLLYTNTRSPSTKAKYPKTSQEESPQRARCLLWTLSRSGASHDGHGARRLHDGAKPKLGTPSCAQRSMGPDRPRCCQEPSTRTKCSEAARRELS